MGYSKLILKSGWKINYWESGPASAPVILFIHGLSESCEFWMQAMDCREMQKYRCVVIDLLGFGNSDKPETFDYSMEKQAETIQEFLIQKNIDQVVYIGHSMGGAVGMALLDLHPETIQKIVLVDATLTVQYAPDLLRRLISVTEWWFNFVFPLMLLRSRKIGAAIFFEVPTKEMLDMGSRVAKQAKAYSVIRTIKSIFLFLEKRQLTLSLKNSQIPHYFIYGMTDLRLARMVKDYFADESWVRAIPNVKHCPMVEDPDTFSKILDDILSKRGS